VRCIRSIRYSQFPSQARFHESKARFKGFSGPVGSGKSRALCQEALKLAYANGGCPGVVGAPTYPMLRDVTRATFLEILERDRVRFRFFKSENAVYLPECESEVRFRSLDDPTRLVGSNLAWFALDELTYTKEDAWRRMEARLRNPRAKRLCGCAAWTPKGFDWVYKRFISPSEKIPGYEAVLAAPGENKRLPEDFYDRLKQSYDERFYQQEVLGEYLNVQGGQVYYAFDRKYHVERQELDPRYPLAWALDFNNNPMCSAIGQLVDETSRVDVLLGRERKSIHVLDELALPHSNTPEACETFAERARAMRPKKWRKIEVRIYGDATGGNRQHSGKSDWEMVREFFAHNLDFEPTYFLRQANPAVRYRIGQVNAALKNAAGEVRMRMDPRCKELVKDFEEVIWKEDSSGRSLGVVDNTDPRRTHMADALGYMVEYEFGDGGGYGDVAARLF
jgi:hypothetical protein